MPPPKLDAALAIAAAMLCGPLAVAAPWAVATVVVAAIVALRLPRARRASPWLVAICAVILAGSIGRAGIAARAVERRHAWAIEVLPHPERCEVHGEVVTMPRVRGVLSADLEIASLDCARGVVALPSGGARVRVHDLPENTARGDTIEAIAELGVARWTVDDDLPAPRTRHGPHAAALSGTAIVARVVGVGHGLEGALDHARARLRRGLTHALDALDEPLARALVLGEEDLSADDADAFRGSGLAHLLAVSGAHVALVIGGLVACLRALLRRWAWLARRFDVARIAAFFGAIAAPIYDQLSGDAASARRATWMAMAILLARACGRRADVWRALAWSIVAMAIADPLAPFDASFAMSIGATLGLLILSPTILARLTPTTLFTPTHRTLAERIRRWFCRAFAASVAASVGCAPMVLAMGAGLPTLGVLANLIAVPLGEAIALPLTNVLALLGLVDAHGLLARCCAAIASIDLHALRAVARFTSSPPALASIAQIPLPPPSTPQLTLLAVVFVTMHVASPSRARVLALAPATIAAWLLLELAAIARGHPRGRLTVTALDVGQGDATLIDLPDGGAVLVDAGGEVGSSFDPGAAIVAPILASHRRNRLDLVILSHPHPDHFLGLGGALGLDRARRDVGALWDDGQGEAEGLGGAYGRLLTSLRARAVPIVRPDALCDRPRTIGGARFEVLHPCPRYDSARGPNDNSLVVRVTFGHRAVLLVGDAEAPAEATLLATARDRLHADLLKVGHHGSRTSSTRDFIAAVAPTVAFVSCGRRNRFGHPSASTLETLENAGVRLFRTDRDGSARWSTDGDRVFVERAAR